MKAIIILDDVPDWQTGEEVQVFFPDTMCKRGKCIAVLDDEGYRDVKRIFERPQGDRLTIDDPYAFSNSENILTLDVFKSNKTGQIFAQFIQHGTGDEFDGDWLITKEIFPEELNKIQSFLDKIKDAEYAGGKQ